MSAPAPTSKPAAFIFIVGIIIIFVAIVDETLNQKGLANPISHYLRNGVVRIGETTVQEDPTTYEYFKVTRVVDGDTLEVDMHGFKEKVRLIGINTPETVDPRRDVGCFGKEASSRMKDLASGEMVRLESDPTQSFRDTYDRLLAYVYLEDGQMLNRKMLAEGYAYEYTYGMPYKYQREFRELVALARTSGRGLWSTATCNGKE